MNTARALSQTTIPAPKLDWIHTHLLRNTRKVPSHHRVLGHAYIINGRWGQPPLWEEVTALHYVHLPISRHTGGVILGSLGYHLENNCLSLIGFGTQPPEAFNTEPGTTEIYTPWRQTLLGCIDYLAAQHSVSTVSTPLRPGPAHDVLRQTLFTLGYTQKAHDCYEKHLC